MKTLLSLSRGWVLMLAAALAFSSPAGAQSPETRPAPGEEAMQPTRLGIRLTPTIARGLGRLWVRETLWKDAELTEEQEQRIADATARRLMDIGRRDGREGQAAIECLFETMMETRGHVNADNCREFGQKMEPLARAIREILGGAENDAREIVSAEQFKQLEPEFAKQQRALDRFERRLQSYRDGQVGEHEKPFDELDVEDEDTPGKPKVDQRVRNARRTADWQMRQITTWEWSRFLAGAATMFKFDEAQRAKGDALLAAYRKKAEAVQTPEWKARVRRNRTLASLQWQLEDVPRGPWVYQIEQEYQEAVRPLKDLGDEFFKEVLALATREQQAEAVNSARSVFQKHGLAVGDTEAAMIQGLLR